MPMFNGSLWKKMFTVKLFKWNNNLFKIYVSILFLKYFSVHSTKFENQAYYLLIILFFMYVF